MNISLPQCLLDDIRNDIFDLAGVRVILIVSTEEQRQVVEVGTAQCIRETAPYHNSSPVSWFSVDSAPFALNKAYYVVDCIGHY